MKTIMMIGKRHYVVSLLEDGSGEYRIRRELDNERDWFSSPIRDLKTALHIFDLIVENQEGN